MASFSDEELAVIAICLDEEEEQSNPTKKRKWIHDAWKKRDTEGEYVTLYKELLEDDVKFHQYFRMSKKCFNLLFSKISENLRKQDTHWRKAISPTQRLAVCLRYLATGDSFLTISFSFLIGHSTVQDIVHEACKVICNDLMAETLPEPSEEMWKAIAEDFNTNWNFPNCVGALDGKHITIQAPPNSGSLYFNYKKTFSIVLMALVDANYNFLIVDIGEYGRNSDGGIFANSSLGKRLQQGTLRLPRNTALPNTGVEAPYVIVGDEALPLKPYLLRPYPRQDLNVPERVYNYRHCRARRVVVNTFGILSQKFRIYNRRIQAAPKNVDNIVLATCILHNFVEKYDGYTYNYEKNESKVERTSELQNLPLQGGNATVNAFSVREIFKDYFNSPEGSLPWQLEKI